MSVFVSNLTARWLDAIAYCYSNGMETYPLTDENVNEVVDAVRRSPGGINTPLWVGSWNGKKGPNFYEGEGDTDFNPDLPAAETCWVLTVTGYLPDAYNISAEDMGAEHRFLALQPE
jgi:hypothetical protein